jgi:hypothetical protein
MCTITQEVTQDCESNTEGFKIITWEGTWTGEIKTGTTYERCIAGGEVSAPCVAQIQLPFFDYIGIIGSLIFIALIYISLIFKKRKK